jgi:hypothetical protein
MQIEIHQISPLFDEDIFISIGVLAENPATGGPGPHMRRTTPPPHSTLQTLMPSLSAQLLVSLR